MSVTVLFHRVALPLLSSSKGHALTSSTICTCPELAPIIDSIIVVQRQLEYTSSNNSHLMDHYQLIRHQYHQQNSSAANALKALEPSDLEWRAIQGGYEYWAWVLGLNFTKMYWDPWIEAKRTAEVARLNVTAFEDEMSRLEKTTQVALEINHCLDRLAFVVYGGAAKGNCGGWIVEARDIFMLVRQLRGQSLDMGEVNPDLDNLDFLVYEGLAKGNCGSRIIQARDILMLVRRLWDRSRALRVL